VNSKVSIPGDKSLGSRFLCFGRGFDYYEVKKKKKNIFKKKMEKILHF
jgi:hypothetical protein